MPARRLRVADVFRAHWAEYDRTHSIAPHQAKAVRHLLSCRTASLGGHLHRCANCGSEVPVYNSCLDRHCPTCQTAAKEEWLDDRRAELLPVEYFHTVFTVPHLANSLIDANRELLLGELFSVVHWVLQHFATDPRWRLEGQLGYLAVLHTWTQLLTGHFHLHCVIPGGVWRTGSNRWVPMREGFLFGKQPLCDAFRNRFVKRLETLRKAGKLSFNGGAVTLAESEAWDGFIATLKAKGWIVEARPTAAGPEQALAYLARYVYRVAIGDHRILAIQDGRVRFAYRDRRDGDRQKVKELPAADFIQRFLYHILPDHFVKVRYYGWLAPTRKQAALAAIRGVLGAVAPPPLPPETPPERILRLTGIDIRRCPHCEVSALVYIGRLEPTCARGPP